MRREVRVCEVCGTQNTPSNSECTNCGEDLAFVVITSVEEENAMEIKMVEETTIDHKTVGEITDEGNKVLKDKCRQSSIDNQLKRTMILSNNLIRNIVDGKCIEVPQGGCVIGRSGNIEVKYFQQFPFISNSHASLGYECGELFVNDNGSTNGTKVNGVKLIPGNKRVLNIGDLILFANIEFIVE